VSLALTSSLNYLLSSFFSWLTKPSTLCSLAPEIYTVLASPTNTVEGCCTTTNARLSCSTLKK
jgi:hypothetical protein